MLKVILASSNSHKANEFNQLFDAKILTISTASKKLEVVEDGTTFRQNAYKKAHHYFEHFNSPVMADDSGLIVNSLPNELGVKTARFGGDGLTDGQRCQLLLEKLKPYPEIKQRAASFQCVLCFHLSKDEIFFFEGQCKGHIGLELTGGQGFGYDPLFIPKGHPNLNTFAADPQFKANHSHRFKACCEAIQFFQYWR